MAVDPSPTSSAADRVFVDTNVFAYLLDHGAPEKRERAAHLLRAHSSQIVVSTQVLYELYNVATVKFAAEGQITNRLLEIVSRFAVVSADRALVVRAIELAGEREISIFDAAIIAAAERAQCSMLLTEDASLRAAAGAISAVDPFA